MGAVEIRLWYGDRQRFTLGTPQRWINVLGTVTSPHLVRSLEWSLDGGPPSLLQIGPDGLRLLHPGDFNIEVPVSALRCPDHRLCVRAHLAGGSCVETEMVLIYDAEAIWPVPYSADLAGSDPLSAVQVVEGQWVRTDQGLRTRFAGYDRLLAVGDQTWRDYSISVCASIHGYAETADDRLRGGFGILTRWSGHRADGHQPSREWRPNGTIGWYRARWEDQPACHRNLNISDAVHKDVALVETGPLSLAFDTPHVFTMDVTSEPGKTSLYRYRVWSDRDDRPLCDLSARGQVGEAECGSVLLIALHVDVTIHSIEIHPPLDRQRVREFAAFV